MTAERAMIVRATTRPAPGGINDDLFVVGADFAIVLDGATAPRGRDSGCRHDVPWLVARLAANVVGRMPGSTEPLAEILAEAIRATVVDHDGCDTSNPDSPSSTVTIVRRRSDEIDYLVLGDSPLVARTVDGTVAIVDDRVERLPSYTYDAVARLRNSDDGFWVASTDPEAAHRALSGTLREPSRVLLLTDGASRLADRYGMPWDGVLDLADDRGPEGVLDEVRRRDAAARDVRGKRFDDATAVLCRIVATGND